MAQTRSETEKKEKVTTTMIEANVADISSITEDDELLSVIRRLQPEKKSGYTMEFFKKCLEEKTVFSYEFTFIDGRGSLYSYEEDGDIEVRMSTKEMEGFSRKLSGDEKTEILASSYKVVVHHIDEQEKMVFLSASEVFREPREKLIQLINEGIEKKIYVRTPARVYAVTGKDKETKKTNNSVLMVDIGGLGIVGAVRLKEWSTSYTNSYKGRVKPGDIIEVVVTGKQAWKSGMIYDCSRRRTIDFNPWKGIEEKAPKGTVVRVVCTDLTPKNFFGVVKGVPEINAYCEYPNDPNMNIVVGEEYVGRVAKVSEKTKLFRVRISKAVDKK